jgi:predicted DsbA family dithiol-disulfide isomerase
MTVIEVFADACCPFAHVGLRRIRAACDERGADAVLRVRAWPLELVNGTPLDAPFITEEIDEIREQVAGDLFVGYRESSFPASSIPAMALTARAYAVSDRIGEQVALAVRDALFERGLDIGDRDVLRRIGAEHGVDVADDPAADDALVRGDWDDGRERHVVGSPHFFIDGDNVFCPVLDIKRVDGHLRIGVDTAAMESFLARVAG